MVIVCLFAVKDDSRYGNERDKASTAAGEGEGCGD